MVILVIFVFFTSSCKKDEITKLPQVTTNEVSQITSTSAFLSASVTNSGGNEVIDRGICWSSSPEPTLDGNYVVEGRDMGDFTITINGLMPNKKYYVRAYARNSLGVAYGNEISFTTLTPIEYDLEIGKFHDGGIIFYIDPSGAHGLIADTVDLGKMKWRIAIEECNNLVKGGFDDWFLGSQDQLILLYEQKDVVGGFESFDYWCSTEIDDTSAWTVTFGSGENKPHTNGASEYVRAIRQF